MKKLTKLLVFGAIVCLCGNDGQTTYARTKDGKAQSYYEIAQDMVDGMNERKTEFKIYYTGFTPDEINDNESIIFDYANGIDGYAMHSYSSLDTVEYNQKKGEYIIKPKYLYTNKQRQELLTFVENEMSNIITNDMDNMKKVEAIRLWLNDYLVYDDSEKNDNDYEAMIYKSGNCTGYSMLFETACEVAGVPCRTISGLYGKAPHAWNSVYVDGKWQYLEPQQERNYLYTIQEMEGYAYFADSDIDPVLTTTEKAALEKAGELVSNKYIPKTPLDIVYSEVPGTMNNSLVITCSIADAEVRLYYNPEKVNSYEEARTKSLSVVAFGDDLYGIDVAKATYLGQGKSLTHPKNLSGGNYTVIVEAVSPTQGVTYKRYRFSSSNLTKNIPTETMSDYELVQLVDKAKTLTTATIKDGTLVLDTNTKGVKIISYELDDGKETMVFHMDTKYDTGVMLTKGTHKVTIHISSIQQMGTGHFVMARVDSTIVVTDKDLKDAKQKQLLKEANTLVTIAMTSMKETDVAKAEKAVAKLSTSSEKKELTTKLNSVKQAIEAKQVKEAEKAVQNAKKLRTKSSVSKAKKLIELIDVKATRTALLKELQKIKIK